jgi:predicted acylesterase/phospholipase RssA
VREVKVADSHRKTTFFQTCLGVFQGGGCRAAAFAGAYTEAVEHDVHFAEVAGTSAGSITAALIGAGAKPAQLSKSIADLDFKQFMAEPDPVPRSAMSVLVRSTLSVLRRTPLARYTYFVSHLGMYSSSEIQKWVEQELHLLLPHIGNRPIRFGDLPIPTWVVATDLKTGNVETWSTRSTPNEEVAPAVRASCSIPVFFQPVASRYVDGGTLSNLPTFVFSGPGDRPLSSRILAFTLEAQDDDPDLSSASGLVRSLLNAVVDGSRDLQLHIQRGVHVISIPTGDVKATDFEKMTPDTVALLVGKGQEKTHEFFEAELTRVQTAPPLATICHDEDEVFSAITENLDRPVDEILISEETTDWVYSLFPAIFYWRARGVRIRTLLNKYGDKPGHVPYRRRLLRSLGVEVYETTQVPGRAYIFNPGDAERTSAIVGIQSTPFIAAIRYTGYYDHQVLEALRKEIDSLCIVAEESHDAAPLPRLVPATEDELLKALRRVPQYSLGDVELTVSEIPLESLISLTSFVKEYKYRQARRLIELYGGDGINCFTPASVLMGDQSSLVTPPVVEESGGSYILIQGTARAVFCRDQGVDKIWGVVARGVRQALPTDRRINIRGVRIAGRDLAVDTRYGESFNYEMFRPIENRVHPVENF